MSYTFGFLVYLVLSVYDHHGPSPNTDGTRTSIAAYISQLHAAMLIHMQDPYSEFHSVLERTRTLLWSLPFDFP